MSEKTKIKKKQIGNKKTFGQYFRAHWQLYVMIAPPIIMLLSVCSLSNLFFRFHTTTLTEACSNELKQHHL